MIRKIIAIKNVGRFRSYSASGDVEFRRLTILFGENGRGKTTLSAIFRSLKTGTAAHVLERRTISSPDQPHIHFLLRAGTAEFRDGAWSSSIGEIEVFDDTFVHRNVYAGDCVDHDHKKNLYRVIVGEEGVALATEVDALDGKIRDANKRLADLKESVGRSCPDGMAVDTFIGLKQIDDLDAKIEAQTTEIVTHAQQDEILARRPLDRISLPAVPPAVAAVLAKDIEGASAAAEAMVKAHLAKCAGTRGETWATEGLGYVKEDACPFCGADTSASGLLAAYRVFFGDSYRAIKKEVTDAERAVEDALGEGALLRLQKSVNDNLALHKFWNPLTGVDLPDLSFDGLRSVLEELRGVTRQALAQKSAAILEAVRPGPDFDAAVANWQITTGSVDTYNLAVDAVNQAVSKLKSAGGVDVDGLRLKLADLNVVRLRYSPAVADVCTNHVEAGKTKKKLDAEKKKAKKKLDDYTSSIFEKYQEKINDLLTQFNTGFRIDKTKGRYVGGSPSSTFVLVINNAPVELDDDKAAPGNPCFKNTLSAGDRSALALAFFIARLYHDPKISDKIVVIDDPITSQDMFRATCTRQLISRLYSTAKQVIVLSHSPIFLKNLYENSVSRDVKALQISRDGDHSAVTEWDIENDTRSEYYQNYHDLHAYQTNGTGEKRHVARCIRVLLEEYFRLKAPQHFRRTEWLGDFIEKVRKAQAGDPLHGAQPLLAELEDINGYSKRYHHRENPGADTEPITDGELQSFVRRTIDLVGRF